MGQVPSWRAKARKVQAMYLSTGEEMSAFSKACGVDCLLCDCGRVDNKCKFEASKRKGRLKALGITREVSKPTAKKESKAAKKKRRKRGGK